MADGPSAALRVSQLDAHELDREVLHVTKSQLSNLFKYFQTGFLGKYNPELTALIKLLLWKYTLSDSGSTVGQQLLGIQYAQTKGANTGSWVSSRQKAWLAVLYIGCPWLRERLSRILNVLGLSSWEDRAEKCVQLLETALKVAALVNFLVFLRRGVYLSLPERLVGVQAKFPQRQHMRQVSFDFMTREILWHGFSEFLLFILPLISIQRVKNTALRWLGPKNRSSDTAGREERCQADYTACVVCGEWPVHPHHINCRHVFCYYCLASNLKADPGYTCPVCGGVSGSVVPQPVRLTVGPAER